MQRVGAVIVVEPLGDVGGGTQHGGPPSRQDRELGVQLVQDPAIAHVVWACPSCGARARQDRPREGVDVEQFLGPEVHSWPS